MIYDLQERCFTVTYAMMWLNSYIELVASYHVLGTTIYYQNRQKGCIKMYASKDVILLAQNLMYFFATIIHVL